MGESWDYSSPRKDVPRKGNVDRNKAVELNHLTHCDVPRKGNVDRNSTGSYCAGFGSRTFPARGTWIEISRALRKAQQERGRSPQGERG